MFAIKLKSINDRQKRKKWLPEAFTFPPWNKRNKHGDIKQAVSSLYFKKTKKYEEMAGKKILYPDVLRFMSIIK